MVARFATEKYIGKQIRQWTTVLPKFIEFGKAASGFLVTVGEI
jgi:hypothetical protein